MVFVHGFFHADPHPANILVRDPDHISLVDFGMTEQLTPARPRGGGAPAARHPRPGRRAPAAAPARAGRALPAQQGGGAGRPAGRHRAALLGHRRSARSTPARCCARSSRRSTALGITLPARWVMLDKTVATLAGVALEIYPDLNVFEVARPYAVRLAARALPARPHRRARARRHGALRRGVARLPVPGLRAARRVQGRRRRDHASGPRASTEAVDKLAGERQPARPRRSSPRRSDHRLRGHRGLRPLDRRRRPVAARAARVHRRRPCLVAWLCVGIFRSGRW